MPATYSIEQWARFALTGEMGAAAPADPALAPLIASVKAQVIPGHPCLGDDPDTDLTGDDLEAWTEWIGYAVAARYAGTPAGRALIAPATKTVVTMGPVKKETSNSTGTAASLTPADMLRAGQTARARIACIREGIVEANGDASASLFQLAGRRRAIGEATVLERQMLNEGAE